jgi:hypothetical protein
LNKEIAKGELTARKLGGRTLVLEDDMTEYLDRHRIN